MKLKLVISVLLFCCIQIYLPAQTNHPTEKVNIFSEQQINSPDEHLLLLSKQKELELQIRNSEKKIVQLQASLYVSLVVLLIVSLSAVFFWNTNKNKIIQLKIERELGIKQRAYKKTEASSALAKFAMHEETGAVKFIKDELNYKLSQTHPSLTDKDHRLCTLLMLNLSSKEMANILNIQEESVEKSRSRLRKKLNLDSNQNFIEYFNSIK